MPNAASADVEAVQWPGLCAALICLDADWSSAGNSACQLPVLLQWRLRLYDVAALRVRAPCRAAMDSDFKVGARLVNAAATAMSLQI